jgi:hypothetical protein
VRGFFVDQNCVLSAFWQGRTQRRHREQGVFLPYLRAFSPNSVSYGCPKQILGFWPMNHPQTDKSIQLLDVVTLTENIPQHHLWRGEIGTVVECYDDDAYDLSLEPSNKLT